MNITSAKKGTFFLLFTYVFTLLLYLFSCPLFILVTTLICALLHEGAHILSARLLGRRVGHTVLCPAGILPDVSCGGEVSGILIYLAGPLSNICICIAALIFLHRAYDRHLFTVFCVNAALAVYNLTPIPFSDGSGIMKITLRFFLGERVGGVLCGCLELVFSFLFFVFFSYRFFALGAGFFSFCCSFVCVIHSLSHLGRE
ncbi:MAG: hypothetical protein IJE84_03230 [Clostridia bacterium]|nr:hypothetical protein [Clostridia bacterium]